jgi:fluoroquinolone transport system permease protein
MRVGGLIRADLRNILRDPMLAAATILPLLLAAVLRWGFARLAAEVGAAFPLHEYADFATAWILVQAPLLIGLAVGLVLLDERDENVLAAIAVTPVGRRGWLLYRTALPTLASVLACVLVLLLAGLTAIPAARFLPVVLLAGLEAPLITLFLAAFAANKVQALALAKVAGVTVIVPFAALLDSPLRWLGAVVPHYWIAELVLAREAGAAAFWGRVAVALLVHLAVLWVLVGVYRRRAD